MSQKPQTDSACPTIAEGKCILTTDRLVVITGLDRSVHHRLIYNLKANPTFLKPTNLATVPKDLSHGDETSNWQDLRGFKNVGLSFKGSCQTCCWTQQAGGGAIRNPNLISLDFNIGLKV